MVQYRSCKQKFSIQIACKNSQCEYVIMMPDISLVNLKNRSLQKNRQCERTIRHVLKYIAGVRCVETPVVEAPTLFQLEYIQLKSLLCDKQFHSLVTSETVTRNRTSDKSVIVAAILNCCIHNGLRSIYQIQLLPTVNYNDYNYFLHPPCITCCYLPKISLILGKKIHSSSALDWIQAQSPAFYRAQERNNCI